MEEVVLVVIIGGIGLFTRLKRRKKQKKQPMFRAWNSSVCEERGE